jgi:hypothetical protein
MPVLLSVYRRVDAEASNATGSLTEASLAVETTEFEALAPLTLRNWVERIETTE